MHGLQCGFCTPGMIMASIDLLQENPDPTETEVREGIEGNLCRCTGYQNIVKAVQHAAAEMRGEVPAGAGSGRHRRLDSGGPGMTAVEDRRDTVERPRPRRSVRRVAARRTPG